ncbi:MAG: hypothetical protein SGCHY_001296 [Lobulomycetales sp.]
MPVPQHWVIVDRNIHSLTRSFRVQSKRFLAIAAFCLLSLTYLAAFPPLAFRRKLYNEDMERFFGVTYLPSCIDGEGVAQILDNHNLTTDLEYKSRIVASFRRYEDQIKTASLDTARKIYIAPAGAKGYGIFADIDIPSKALIGEYTGERVIYVPGFDTSYSWDYYGTPKTLDGSKEVAIEVDSKYRGNMLRFVNDCLDPKRENVRSIAIPIDNRWVFLYAASKKIKRGEELCVSYGRGYWEERSSGESAKEKL